MSARSLSDRDFTAGEWVVRPRLSRIERAGATVHVTPRAMAVLVHLAEARGAVVSRNELLDAVWPRMTVTPDALSRCLVELRKAFGDETGKPRHLETIPKVGVRLAVPVEASPSDSDTPPGDASVEESPPRTGASVVGTSDEARHDPARVDSTYRKRATHVRIAAATAAALVATGTLAIAWWTQRAGGHGGPETDVVLSANSRALDLYLNANDYAKRTNRVDALKHQEDLYRRATEEDPDFALAWARLGKTHTSLYWYGIDRSPGRLVLAERAIRRALELDQNLGEAHLYLADYYYKGHADDEAALAEFARAERLLTDSPDLYYLRASVHRRKGAWEQSLADGRRAMELDPRNIVYRRQQHLTHTFIRDYASAGELLEGILTLVPDDGTTYVDKVVLGLLRDGDATLANRYAAASPTSQYDHGLAHVYTSWLAALFDRDYAKAKAVLDAAAEEDVFNGDLRVSTVPKALLYARTARLAGDDPRARALFESVARDLARQVEAGTVEERVAASALHLALAEAEVESGDTERGFASMAKARNLVPKSEDALSGSATQLAAIIRVLVPGGVIDEALAELDDYLSGPGQWSIEGLERDPRLDPLRSHPAYAALVEKYRRR